MHIQVRPVNWKPQRSLLLPARLHWLGTSHPALRGELQQKGLEERLGKSPAFTRLGSGVAACEKFRTQAL